MQEPTKEVWYLFHGGKETESGIQNLMAAINFPPVGIVPLEWYRETKVTLDLGGYIPIDYPLQADGTFEDYLFMWQEKRSEDWEDSGYTYGWLNYAGNIDRRRSCRGGGWPYSAARFLMTENPAFYHIMEAKVLSELNARPMWMSGYQHNRDQSVVDLLFGYCWTNWRRNEQAVYLSGTDWHGWFPRDLQHLWIYDIEEHYQFSGDKRIYDWYNFLGEAIIVPLIDELSQGEWGRATRAIAHALAATIQAYKVTGKLEFLETATEAISYIRDRQVHYNGTLKVRGDDEDESEGTFQMGYLSRAIINYLIEIGDSDPQAEVDAWGVLQGLMEWNLHLSKFCYYWPIDSGTPSPNSQVFIDPQAWFYHHSGINDYKDQLEWYYDDSSLGNPDTWGWEGDNVQASDGPFIYRLSHYIRSNMKDDMIPPEKITNLKAKSTDKSIDLTWTAPIDAAKYHIRWSTKPISQIFTTDSSKCNYWAARGKVIN